MKIYIFKEVVTGYVGAYSTKKKAIKARNRLEKGIKKDSGLIDFRFNPDEYSIIKIKVDN